MTCRCGAPLPPSKAPGPARKWCSESCRKRYSYSGSCVDCGAPTAYSGQARPSERCVNCAAIKAGAEKKVWTHEAIAAALCAWVEEHGKLPRTYDWNPWQARHQGVEPNPAYESQPGRWPHFHTVLRAFGSWRAAVEAAGFTPRKRGYQRSLPSAVCCKTPGNQIGPATGATVRDRGNQERGS